MLCQVDMVIYLTSFFKENTFDEDCDIFPGTGTVTSFESDFSFLELLFIQDTNHTQTIEIFFWLNCQFK